ncbi:hypothetical protein ACFR99_04730 [Haloarchaeobius amylolyticus]|uniref:DUF7982 domain-containing protein n=1 Tax=Haloarchaeobius amylolyticus TaxID=1198296 RepID=A0ABD6BDK0_9EURY
MSGKNSNNAVSTEATTDPQEGEVRDDQFGVPSRDERDWIEYESSSWSRYQRTTLGLAVVGFIAAGAGVVFPDARRVLFALAGTGLFGGLLAYTLSLDRVVDATVADHISAAAAANQVTIADELGLRTEPTYVPSDGAVSARLQLSRSTNLNLDGPTTSGHGRELTFEPTAGRLFRYFERVLEDELATDPQPLTAQLAGGLVEVFELADAIEPYHIGEESVTVTVSGSVLGDLDRFDHPIASFLAVGFAVGLDQPVNLEVAPGADEGDWQLICYWGSRRE